jgi:aspartyl aminopeptidase
MDPINGMMDFIRRSPTAFHAVANLREMLEGQGFRPLNECESWKLVPGGRYCVTRNQSSIIAFRIPKGDFNHFQLVASHSDSPCFKLKPSAGRDSNGYAILNVEKYGGMIMQTWFDRPLSIAGRAVVRTAEGIGTRLVCLDRDLALIPNLPIHFNRAVNDGVKLNPQVDMLPVIGEAGTDYMALVAEALGVDGADILGCDLYLVIRDEPRRWGAKGEYIASPRLDDLECAYASIRALLDAKPSDHVDMACVFDNEEVGSGTRQGADSTFLSEVTRRIVATLGGGDYETALARSMMLSADNAHGVHPNHPEKYDENNRVALNGGVVVKFNAAQKYTSDGVSQAVFEEICRRADVPVQRFANRSDIPGGSTLGNIANTHASMITVDIGLAQLSMHAANESAGAYDLAHMIRAMRAFHETEVVILGDGRIRLMGLE